MKTKSAFTIVELIVVISIIAILSTLAIITYGGIRKDSRDATRSSNATVISEALEKYYDRNGEYPSVASLVNTVPGNTGTAVASKLSISPDILRMPKMPSSATNSITVGPTPSNDYIAYIGKSDVNDTKCQSDASSGCDRFTLRYIEESGSTKVIESRHKGRSSDTPSTSDTAGPTISASIQSTNVVVTVDDFTPCNPSSLTPKFAYKYRTKGGDDATWSAWSNPTTTWTPSMTYSIPGSQGTTYEFTSYSRCDNGATPGAISLEGAVASTVYPIQAPTAPDITLFNNADGTITFQIDAVTCGSGTTPQYSYRWHNSTNSYGGWSTFGGGRAWKHTPTAGYSYYYQGKARCHMTNTDSAEAIGSEATYFPAAIAAPAAPVVTITVYPTTYTWNWNAASCPAGTTAQYQTKVYYDDLYDSGWRAPVTTTSYSWYSAGEGYYTTLEVQARCSNASTGSPWSASGSASYGRPVQAPAAPTNFVGTLSDDRLTYRWTWTKPTCGNSTQAQSRANPYIEPPRTWASTGASGWEGWGAQGYWSPSLNIVMEDGTQIPAGTRYQVQAQYICVNVSTGRSSAWGAIGTSPLNTVP